MVSALDDDDDDDNGDDDDDSDDDHDAETCRSIERAGRGMSFFLRAGSQRKANFTIHSCKP